NTPVSVRRSHPRGEQETLARQQTQPSQLNKHVPSLHEDRPDEDPLPNFEPRRVCERWGCHTLSATCVCIIDSTHLLYCRFGTEGELWMVVLMVLAPAVMGVVAAILLVRSRPRSVPNLPARLTTLAVVGLGLALAMSCVMLAS